MEHLIYGIGTFLIAYFAYCILLINNKERVVKIYKSTEALILKKKFKVNTDKMQAKSLARIIGVSNSLIMALTIEIMFVVSKSLLIQMIVGFVLIIIFIFIVYSFWGVVLRKKYHD